MIDEKELGEKERLTLFLRYLNFAYDRQSNRVRAQYGHIEQSDFLGKTGNADVSTNAALCERRY